MFTIYLFFNVLWIYSVSSPFYVNLYFQSNSWEKGSSVDFHIRAKASIQGQRDRSPDTRGQYCSTDSRADDHFSEKLMTGTVCNKNFHLIAEITDYNWKILFTVSVNKARVQKTNLSHCVYLIRFLSRELDFISLINSWCFSSFTVWYIKSSDLVSALTGKLSS